MTNHTYNFGDTVMVASAGLENFRAVVTGTHYGRHMAPKYSVKMVLPGGALGSRELTVSESTLRGLANEPFKG